MRPPNAESVREVLRDCEVVLLAATEAEAAPVRTALVEPAEHVVATKTVYTGLLTTSPSERPRGPGVPVVVAVTDCDKTNAAHMLTYLLETVVPMPRLVLQFGIAGAFVRPRGELEVQAAIGDVVLATSEAYSDTGSSSPQGWLSAADLGLPVARIDGLETGGEFPLDPALVGAAADVLREADWLDGVVEGPCVTSSRVTGLYSEAEETVARWGAVAESMEGAAAAHICTLYGVPFLEIRAVSNLVVDRDRSSWQVERAVAVAGRAALVIVAAFDRLPIEWR